MKECHHCSTSFQKSTDQLFYETLSIPLQEYESKKSLKVSWHSPSAEEVCVINLLLDKEATVGTALQELARRPDGGSVSR